MNDFNTRARNKKLYEKPRRRCDQCGAKLRYTKSEAEELCDLCLRKGITEAEAAERIRDLRNLKKGREFEN